MKDDVQNLAEVLKGGKPKLKSNVVPFIVAPTNYTPRFVGAVENRETRVAAVFSQPYLTPSQAPTAETGIALSYINLPIVT